MHPPRIPSTGFIDESIHSDAHLYVIGMVLAASSISEEARRRLSAVIPTARVPHWSQEDAQTRAMLIREIGRLSVRARVYGCRFERPKRKEAARARALTWLVQDLPNEIRQLVLAERETNQDRNDRRVLGGPAGRPLRFAYDHAPASKEPLLWVADVVVSSVAKALARGEDPGTVGLGDVLVFVGCEPAI